jgi:hypothetical protein
VEVGANNGAGDRWEKELKRMDGSTHDLLDESTTEE